MTDHVFDQLPAYSLGALDPPELAEVEEHLEKCEMCRLELASLADTLGALPLSLDPVSPPTDLKRRVLAAAGQQEPDFIATDGGAKPVSESRPPEPRDTPSHMRPRSTNRSPAPLGVTVRLRPLSLSVATGFAVILFAVGLLAGTFFHSGANVAERYDHLVAAAVANGDRVIALRPATGSSLVVHLSVAQTPSGATGLILGPTDSPPPGKVYQLWFIRGKHPVSVGIFHPNTSVAATVSLPTSAQGFQVAAMTLEPGPYGAQRPTTTPFVSGRFAG